MKLRFLSIFACMVLITISGCKKEDDPVTDWAIAAADWGKLSITFVETGGPTNTWVFNSTGGTGQATLTGTGDFGFTYVKDGVNKTTLIFDVGGSDKYEMTWTEELKGTIVESFNGTPGNNGSFTIVKQ
ncbi:MAG TPA: hypothetical protein P5228_05465 [Bacteroidales bacterium]|nr:hypothetical protein [Bacteroidales bacterium]HRZ47794.1 hypothetical protein [Bacteroidales bacterium]